MTHLGTPGRPKDSLTAKDVVAPMTATTTVPSGLRQATKPNAIAVGLIATLMVAVSIAILPGPLRLFGGGLALLMLAIAVIDARRFIIPDSLSAASLALALASAAVQAPDAILPATLHALIRGVALALMLLAFRNGYAWLRGQEGIGLGDVKLAGIAGAWLDWSTMPILIELAAVAALTTYLVRHLTRGQPMSATHRLPFGLFLAPAIWVCWLLEMALLTPN